MSAISIALLLCFAAGLALLFAVAERASTNRKVYHRQFYLIAYRPQIALYLLLLISIVSLYFFSVSLPQFFGPIFIFCIFMIFLTVISGQLALWSKRRSFPFLGMLVFVGFIFEVFNLNDNHELRAAAANNGLLTKAALTAPPPTAAEQFEQWFRLRRDRTDYEAKGILCPIICLR